MAVVIEEPSFWDSATTVEVFLVPPNGPSSQMQRADVDLLSYGIAIPADNTAGWPAQILPWWIITSITKIS